MKFGGTSVADAASISRVTDIIRQYHWSGNEVAVVISAQRGVTDQLIAIAMEVVNSPDSSMVGPFIESLRVRHMKALEGSAKDYVAEVAPLIEDRLEKLQNILYAVHNLRDLTPRSKDYIITFGERLNSLVVSSAFRQQGIPSTVLDGCEAGILTTANHGEAMALPEGEKKIKNSIVPLLSSKVPVIMGFMGCTGKGILTTLGRSGSDYSAAIIGAGIDADEIWIWTDVDGIMTSDPRVINDARVLDSVSYLEVMETLVLRGESNAPTLDRTSDEEGYPCQGEKHLQSRLPRDLHCQECPRRQSCCQGDHLYRKSCGGQYQRCPDDRPAGCRESNIFCPF